MDAVKGRDELLQRVRTALHGRRCSDAGSGAIPVQAGAGSPAERVDLFRGRFEALGGTFVAGASAEAAARAVGEALRDEGVTALLVPDGDPAARALAEALAPLGPFRFAAPGEIRQAVPPVCAGIQTAEYAVAETGTLVQTSGGGRTLLPGLVTDVHVSLVAPDAFVDRMEECLAALANNPPRNISFITGPSRTADIELTLTIGVHGPGKVIAVLLAGG
ncbi:MAG: LutC/YkgG family protein [Gemmatimonadota bacterium]